VERGTATVRVTTGAARADAYGVEHIDVLKIDTEGYELQVLAGFERFLAASKVGAVLAECEFERVTPEPHTGLLRAARQPNAVRLRFRDALHGCCHVNRFAWGNALFARSNFG
jgi:Methyltransferase FkbM domain